MTQGFLWHVPDGGSRRTISEARRRMRTILHSKWPWPLRPVAWLLSMFTWPYQCFREAGIVAEMSDTRACPEGLRRRAVLAGLRNNVSPGEFASYGMWREGSAPADSWVFNAESTAATASLTDRSVRDLTGDKVAFAEFCRENGDLAVAETLAVFREGRCVRSFPADRPPAIDLVTKPVRAAHATGFRVWRPEKGAFRCTSEPSGPAIPVAEFSDHLAEMSNQYARGLLVQPFLSAHPSVEHLSGAGPAVARIITGRWKDGRVDVLDTILQKPPRDAYLLTGGSMRLIDAATGMARPIHPGAHLFPANTADPAFDGLQLPDWERCCKTLVTLHAAIRGQAPLLGWDIVFATGGPTILEANTTLSAYTFQTAGQEPAANGKWTALLAEYLE